MQQEKVFIDDYEIKIETYEIEQGSIVQSTQTIEEQEQTEEFDADDQEQTEESDAKSEEECEELVNGPDEVECAVTAERKRSKQYFCCVLGCRNVRSLADPPQLRISMFSVPSEPSRRKRWLRMIDRYDLLSCPSTQYVCEAHFYPGSIIPTATRKLLQKNAIPILNLPITGGKEVDFAEEGTQVWVTVAHKHCQAQPPTVSKHSQTTVDLLQHLPAVLKLKQQVKLLSSVKRNFGTKKNELKVLHELCDKYMSDKFATLVKIHLRNKEASSGNRYGEDFKKYCLRLCEASPKAYEILREVLPLPGQTYLKTKKKSLATGTSEANVDEVLMDMENPSDTEIVSLSDVEEAGPSCSGAGAAAAAVAALETTTTDIQVDQESQTNSYVQLMSHPIPDLNFHIN